MLMRICDTMESSLGDDDLRAESKKNSQHRISAMNVRRTCEWLENPPLQESCIGRDGQPDQPGDGQEVQKPQDVDVGLVDGIDLRGRPRPGSAVPADCSARTRR